MKADNHKLKEFEKKTEIEHVNKNRERESKLPKQLNKAFHNLSNESEPQWTVVENSIGFWRVGRKHFYNTESN